MTGVMIQPKVSKALVMAAGSVILLGLASLGYLIYIGLFQNGRTGRGPAGERRCTPKSVPLDCGEKVVPVPTRKTCPEKGRFPAAEIGEYRITVRASSPDFCFANVRSDTNFKKGHDKNIMFLLDHGQPFCARRRGSYFWELALKDPNGNLCRGYVASALSECASEPAYRLGISCDERPHAVPVKKACPADGSLIKPPGGLSAMRVRSAHHCYANIRSSGRFPEGYEENILARARHDQPFCGKGPYKYKDPSTGARGAVYYVALLRDPNGRYCWGYLSMFLVNPR